MKHLKQSTVVLAMVLMGACDEKMMGENDTSTSESCVLYASPGAGADAGDGESETSPLSSVDAVISKASALKSRCGDAAEVRFADGSLTSEQLGIVTEALKSAGIKVGRYSSNDNVETSSSSPDKNLVAQKMIAPSSVGLETAAGLSDKLTGIENSLSTQDNYTPQSGSTPWWEESGSTNNIYYDTGNVAIGAETAATSKLQISGTECSPPTSQSMPVGTLRLESTNDQYMFLDGNEIDVYGKSSPWDGSTLHLNYNSEGNVTIAQNGGNVGVGTAPVSNVTMTMSGTNLSSSGGYGSLRINDTSSTATYIMMDGNEIDGANGLHLNAKFNKPVYIAGDTAGSNYVYMVRGSGNVGIGNLTETQITHKLTVDGAIKAEEIVVDTVGGADFVFEDGYDLMSLDETEAFVKANRHLPDVAPAETMQQNGLEMGEFQIKLLQKVEELTLYAIEQNKRIKSVEEENRALRKMIELK